MRAHRSTAIVALVLGSCLLGTAATAQVTKKDVPGVTNFAQVETTVACAGATRTEAIPELKKMGFVSIINLRLATENGADIEAEAAAAKAAGLKFYHLPLNGQMPDPAVADKFLAAITTEGSEPAFIHCAWTPRPCIGSPAPPGRPGGPACPDSSSAARSSVRLR